MGGQVLVDLAGVEAALRQQRTGYRTQREQNQQHQRGAHRGQRAPGVAGPGANGGGGQIGNLTSDTNASRSHEMNSFHAPVTSRAPTAISSAPPKIWMARVCRRSPPRPPTAPAEPNASAMNG